MKPYRFHQEGESDADEATSWYLERNPDRAFQLALALQRSYRRISESPAQFPRYFFGTRRCVLQDFPYIVIFYEFPDAIQIIAVAHAKRRPGYWKSRLKTH